MNWDLCCFSTECIPPTRIMRMSCRVLVFFVIELNMHLAQELEKLQLEELWARLLLHANLMTPKTSDGVHELKLCLAPCTNFTSIKEHSLFFTVVCQFLDKVSHANLELNKERNSGKCSPV